RLLTGICTRWMFLIFPNQPRLVFYGISRPYSPRRLLLVREFQLLQRNQIGTYTVTVANGIGLGFTPSQPASLLVGISYPLTVQLYAGLQVLGTVGLVYSIQCTPDLTQTNNWQTLTNLTLPSSPYLYIDTASPDYPRRFYR